MINFMRLIFIINQDLLIELGLGAIFIEKANHSPLLLIYNLVEELFFW